MKIGWWKFGDDTQLADELGSGITFAWTGFKNYQPCKFDNGVYSVSNFNYLKTLSTYNWVPDSNIVDAWYNKGYSLTNGIPSDAVQHAIFEWFNSGTDRLLWYVNTTGYNMGVKVDNTWYDFYTTTGMTWSAFTNFHLGHRYKRTGLDGGSVTREVWLNGSKINSTNVAPASQSKSGAYWVLAIGGGAWTSKGIIDDLVLYNDGDDKTNFDDREFEGRVFPGGFKLIDGGLRSPIMEGVMVS